MHSATRLLLVLAVMAGSTGPVRAIAPGEPDSTETSHRDRHHHKKPAKEDTAQPEKRPGKAEARKPGEPMGKVQGGRPQPAEQRGHGSAPVAVTPPPPPPPPKPEKEAAEPPPKLPRFAALKTDDTNMRKGPGQRYPIEWVFKRRDLPVEVEREYDVWRYVRDSEGVKGWVHQVTLSDRRTFMVNDADATIRSEADEKAPPVAMLKGGVIGRLRSCDGGSKWCQVQVGNYRGYLRRDQFWGVLPDEVVTPP